MNTQKHLEDKLDLPRPSDLVKSRRGFADLASMASVVSIGVGAAVGTSVGMGAGWLAGNVIDFVPFANHIAPYLAEQAGLISEYTLETKGALNENLYQTAGALSGFFVGASLLPKAVYEIMKPRRSNN